MDDNTKMILEKLRRELGQVPFTGDVLSRTSVEEQRYYVSNVTNSGSGGGYSGFLSSNVVSLDDTSVNPFVNPSGVPYYTGTRTESGYTIYYKDITARYGANIFEEWPDSFHQESLYGKLNNSNRNWYFIGWITDDDAWYWDGSDNGNTANTHGNHSTAPNWQIKGVAPHSSIKGKVETMSEEYLKIWANGKYVTYDTTSTNSPYGAGIAHEYHCRYNDETRTYVYRQYFKNPDTNSYNESNSWNPETKLFDRSNPLVSQVSGGSGSNPSGQNPGTFTGYTLVSRQMISGNENNQPGNLGDWRPYSITGIGSGMIMVYKFDPHPGKIELFDEKGSQITLTEDQEVLKYGQSLAFVNDYAPTVDDEHVFRGWYTDPEGAGTRYDPAVDRFPDTAQPKEATDPLNVGLKLYAVVTPTDKTVTLQYTKPGTTYDPLGGSYVYDWSSFSTISANTFLYDKIGEDDSPAVTTADGALKADLLNYASTLQPSGGFQFNNNVTIYTAEEIADENNEDLSQYRGKYVTQLPNEDDPEHPYPVADVVVIQLERKEFSLSFNTDGANGGSYPTVTYVYGEPLKGTYLDANNRAVPYILDDGHHTPSYTGYTFKYWMLLNDPSAEKGPEVTTDTTMPARAVTVKAHRTGSPVPFSILFWLQNTKDDGDGVNEKDDYTSSIYISNGDDILNGKELMAALRQPFQQQSGPEAR